MENDYFYYLDICSSSVKFYSYDGLTLSLISKKEFYFYDGYNNEIGINKKLFKAFKKHIKKLKKKNKLSYDNCEVYATGIWRSIPKKQLHKTEKKFRKYKLKFNIIPESLEEYYLDNGSELINGVIASKTNKKEKKKKDIVKVFVASKNPTKIEGTKNAFERYFKKVNVDGVPVESDVSDQPFDSATFEGAKNRINNLRDFLKKNKTSYDYIAAAEAGVINLYGHYYNVSFSIIEDNNGFQTYGLAPGFTVPEKYISKIQKDGLGKIGEELFGKKELGKSEGIISFITKGEITRKDIIKESVLMALIGQINEDKWR